MKVHFYPSRLAGLGVTSAVLFGLGTAPVFAGGTNLSSMTPNLAVAGSHDYNYTVSFTTPASFLGSGNGDILFEFDPEAASASPASITGSALTYSSDWQVSPLITTFGDTTLSYFPPSVTVNNTDAANGFSVPVSQWGATAGFNLNYMDPPGPIASNFTVTLQKAGQTDLSLFDIQFNPLGQAVLLSEAPGVTITPQAGTPPLSSPVPEASTTVSFGLLLALGTSAIARARRKIRRGV